MDSCRPIQAGRGEEPGDKNKLPMSSGGLCGTGLGLRGEAHRSVSILPGEKPVLRLELQRVVPDILKESGEDGIGKLLESEDKSGLLGCRRDEEQGKFKMDILHICRGKISWEGPELMCCYYGIFISAEPQNIN